MTLPQPLALDTNCFIYFLDPGQPERAGWLRSNLFEPLVTGRTHATSSTLMLVELLTLAHRRGDEDDARRLRTAVEELPNLTLVPLDADIAALAARLRGASGVTLGDAIHLAAARQAGASAFLTNDRRLTRRDASLEVLILDDLMAADQREATLEHNDRLDDG